MHMRSRCFGDLLCFFFRFKFPWNIPLLLQINLTLSYQHFSYFPIQCPLWFALYCISRHLYRIQVRSQNSFISYNSLANKKFFSAFLKGLDMFNLNFDVSVFNFWYFVINENFIFTPHGMFVNGWVCFITEIIVLAYMTHVA